MKMIQIDSKYERDNKKRGYERTYCFYNEEGILHYSCDIYGECIKEPTIYTPASDEHQSFTMFAKGKLFNATYYLEDHHGLRFATITRKGVGFRWKILGEDNREIARVIDPATMKKAFFYTLFSKLPDSYAISSDKDIIATLCNEKLLKPKTGKPRNIIRKFLHQIFSRGLTLRLESDCLSKIDLKVLIAAMTLLQVHDITGVNKSG